MKQAPSPGIPCQRISTGKIQTLPPNRTINKVRIIEGKLSGQNGKNQQGKEKNKVSGEVPRSLQRCRGNR
jgi:hypothetical protein